jgi:hypothetical protein
MATSPIDLHWSLTTPEPDSAGTKAKVYPMSALPTLENDFFQITDSYVRFTAPVDGFHTTGSKKTRSELRECQPATGKELNWPASGGSHAMGASLVVKKVPNKVGTTEGSVFVGQIHVEGGDAPLFKFKYQSEGTDPATNITTYKVYASFRAKPGKEEDPTDPDSGAKDFLLYPGIPEGARIQYYVKVNPDGILTAYVQVGQDRKEYSNDLTLWLQDNPNTQFYFKAGVYNNVNASSSTPGVNKSEAWFYKLTTTHA